MELRKRRIPASRTALSVGISESTVSLVLARADLSHIDSKKPRRIVRPSHRVTGNRHRPHSGDSHVPTQRRGKQPVDTSPLTTKAEKSPEHLT